MGVAFQTLTAAEILAAIVSDSTKFEGAKIAKILNKPIWEWSAMPPDSFVGTVGDWASVDNSSYEQGRALRNAVTPSQNDEVGLGVFFVPEAGDYTLHAAFVESASHGRYGFILDGVAQTEIEGYGSTDYNATGSITLSSLTVGLHYLALAVPSKHGSSSAYDITLFHVSIIKA